MQRLALVVLLSWPLPSPAGEVTRADVQYDNGRYTLDFTVELAAQLAAVYAIVTDFDRIDRVSPSVIESKRLPNPDASDPSLERRKLVTRTCILIYCLNATMVEDVRRTSADVISTTMVPEFSDFRSGHGEWRLSEPRRGWSRIELHTELEPGFWVPPLIGPWLIKRQMLNEARATARQIEKLAAAG